MSYFTDAFNEFTEQFDIDTNPRSKSDSALAYQYHLKLYTQQFSGTEAMAAFGELPKFFAAIDTDYYKTAKRIVPHDGEDIFTAEQFTTLLGFLNKKFRSPQKDWEIKLLGKAFERLQHTRRSATKKDVLLSREVNVAIHSIQLLAYELQILEEAREASPDPEEFDRLVTESKILEKSFLIDIIHDLSDEIYHEVKVASEGKSTPIDIHYSLGYFYLKREALENPPVDADGVRIPDTEVQAFLDRVANESKAIHYWRNKERYVLDSIASGYKIRTSDFKIFYKAQLEKDGYSEEDIEYLVNLELKNPVSAAIAAKAKRNDRVLGTVEASINRTIAPSASPIVKSPQDIAVEEFDNLTTYFQNTKHPLTRKDYTNLGKLIEALVLAQDIQNSRSTNHRLIPASDIRIKPSLNIPEMEYLSKPTASAWKAIFWVKNNEPALAKVLGYCTPITNEQRKAVIKQQQALQDIIKFNMKSSPVAIAHAIFDQMQKIGPKGQLTGGGLYVLAALCDENLDATLEAISPHLANTARFFRPHKEFIKQWAGIVAAGGSLATMPAMFENAAYHRSPFGLAAATVISTTLFKMFTHPEQAGELASALFVGNCLWNLTRNMGECDPKAPRHKPLFPSTDIKENARAILPTTLFFVNQEAKRFVEHGIKPLQQYAAEKFTIGSTSWQQTRNNSFAKVSTAAAEVMGSIGRDVKRIVAPQVRIHTYHPSDDAEIKYITDAAKFSAAINTLAIGSTVIAHTTHNHFAIIIAQGLALTTALATSVQGRVKLLPNWNLAGATNGVGQALLQGGATIPVLEALGLGLTYSSYYLFSKGNAEMLRNQAKDARG